jgi:hypothetical protein
MTVGPRSWAEPPPWAHGADSVQAGAAAEVAIWARAALQPAMHKKPPKFRPALQGTPFEEAEQHKYGLRPSVPVDA